MVATYKNGEMVMKMRLVIIEIHLECSVAYKNENKIILVIEKHLQYDVAYKSGDPATAIKVAVSLFSRIGDAGIIYCRANAVKEKYIVIIIFQ